MMTKDKGGSAFPHGAMIQSSGMSLRDYFAGQGLAGMMAQHSAGRGLPTWQEQMSWDAYSVADAMLVEMAK